MANRLEDLSEANAALASGRVDLAARKSAAWVRANPRDTDARYLLGRSYAASGRWRDAAGEFRRVLDIQPAFYPALVELGVALAFNGDFAEARKFLQSARALDARPAKVHLGLGLCALSSGDFLSAANYFREALARDAMLADAHNSLGVALDRLGRLEEALECFRGAATLRPDYATAHRNLGDGLLRLGRAAEAAAAFESLKALRAADPLVHADLGAARLAAGEFAAAVRALQQALALDPTLFDAACNLGEGLRNLNDLEGAAAAFRRALSIKKDTAEAYLGLGKIAASQGRNIEAASHLIAAAHLRRGDVGFTLSLVRLLENLGSQNQALDLLNEAVTVNPGNADLQDACGELLHRFGKLHQAVASYNRALQIDSTRPQSLLNLGRALESIGSSAEAVRSIESALSLRPDHVESWAALASCGFRDCDWLLTAKAMRRLRELPHGIDSLHPFLMLAADLEPDELAHSLRRRGSGLALSSRPPAPHRYAHDRLRLAYVSPDFREHPVAHALAGVIDKHDRRRFTTIGISLTTADSRGIGQRLRTAFDEYMDASAMSDAAVAELMRHREIDIAIDLAGYTTGARPAIFSQRGATVQVNFLGFPGSLGVDFMDFIIADDVVLPSADESLYSEQVLRLPNSYLPFDCSRPVPKMMERTAAGLPPEGVVFCAFNNGYKITQPMFEVWMRLLRDIPRSILWLRSMGDAAAANLRAAAAALHVSAERLIFAPFVETIEEHVARLRCADLYLDTLPYNAHTTAAEALWAAVPVVTCAGRGFAGRVGASLLGTAGLHEMIAENLDEYYLCALRVAREPIVLRELHDRLESTRSSAKLFDTERYTRDLETLLSNAWQRGPRP